MKLNDVFPYIAHNTTSYKDRSYKYDILRTLLQNRKDYGVQNDVLELKRNYAKIKYELAKLYPDKHVEQALYDFAHYPEVQFALRKEDDPDNEYEGGPSFEPSDVDEDEDEDEEYVEEEEASDDESEELGDEEAEHEDGEPSTYTVCRDALMAGAVLTNIALSVLIVAKLYAP